LLLKDRESWEPKEAWFTRKPRSPGVAFASPVVSIDFRDVLVQVSGDAMQRVSSLVAPGGRRAFVRSGLSGLAAPFFGRAGHTALDGRLPDFRRGLSCLATFGTAALGAVIAAGVLDIFGLSVRLVLVRGLAERATRTSRGEAAAADAKVLIGEPALLGDDWRLPAARRPAERGGAGVETVCWTCTADGTLA